MFSVQFWNDQYESLKNQYEFAHDVTFWACVNYILRMVAQTDDRPRISLSWDPNEGSSIVAWHGELTGGFPHCTRSHLV